MSTPSELQVQVLFLETLKRQPDVAELANYSGQLDAATITPSGIIAELQDTVEYQKLQGSYAGDLEFTDLSSSTYVESEWTLQLSDVFPGNYNGVTLGNGKIGMVTSAAHDGKMDKAVITTLFDFNSFGQYNTNVTESFRCTRISLFSRTAEDVVVTNHIQRLNMRNGNFRNSYTIAPASSPINNIDVTHDIMSLRQYPYCSLQTFTVTAPVDMSLDVYHEIEGPENLDGVRFTNNVLTVTTDAGQPRTIPFFGATGNMKDSGKMMATQCCYMFDAPTYASKGLNMLRAEPRTAFNKYTLDLTAGTPFVFHVVSSTMTQFDFEHPDIEVNRILINAVTKSVTAIKTEHLTEWNKMWTSNIRLEDKDGLSPSEVQANLNTKRFIKLSLYNIYSMVRDDINVDINPLNLSALDISGHIFWSAELWMLPVLIILKPRIARTLLDYRYYHLEKAKKLAAAHGYKGSKYAYENDTVGYNDVYWDTLAPLYVFNTALISISTWNYYRVTRDLDWLRKKGYEILKNNADFFASKMEYDETEDVYHMPNVMSMNNTVSSDNSLTNYTAKMALKYAIEATYELNFVVDDQWIHVYERIPIYKFPTVAVGAETYANVIKYDEAYNGETMKFLEPLFLLMPYYSKDYLQDISSYQHMSLLKDNVNYYFTKTEHAFENNAMNQLVMSNLWSTISQLETAYADKVASSDKIANALTNVYTYATLPPWGTFKNSLFRKTYNDIAVSSLFVLNLLTGIAGIRVHGGITDARFYYEDFSLQSRTANVMPKTWKRLFFTGVGMKKEMYTITNELYYP